MAAGSDESQPLLQNEPRAAQDTLDDHVHQHQIWLAGEDSRVHTARVQTRRFLSSKTGHYAVLLLVSLDVASIFADFLISLYGCEHGCGKEDELHDRLDTAQDVLGIVSLVFSCLFMLELLASVWAFGFPFFMSKFHCFDAFVIVAGFVIDVCLKGVLEEVGSIVVILRLWRVFKIVEEFSDAAAEQMDVLSERIEILEEENRQLKKELGAYKNGDSSSSE
ncbi:hypothetical protein MMC25_001043 [Agyrium rufum]|nr:hypothetical protein [Agyrium rufum]